MGHTTKKGMHAQAEPGPARDGRSPRSGWSRGALLGTVVVVLAATGGVVYATHSQPVRHLFAIGSRTPAYAGQAVTEAAAGTVPTTVPSVVKVTPPDGSSGVASDAPITVVLSSAPLPGAPVPTLTPPVPGLWEVDGTALIFKPTGQYAPWSRETITVPAGLATPMRSSFAVKAVPLVRAQQLLAELEYLPFNFNLATGQPGLGSEATVAASVSPAVLAGTFTWRYSNIPASLSSLWAPGQENVLTQGAVMQFEADHGLPYDGVVGPAVWDALTQAVATRQIDQSPYDYLVVSESIPEQLQVWRDGQYVYSTPVNTGVPGAVTALGTFPVYARYETTTMTGTDPDGYHYVAPDVPWVAYFNGGDAVHGYPRASYGWPQSNGCVELPISNAQVVWGMDPIGTLVTVV